LDVDVDVDVGAAGVVDELADEPVEAESVLGAEDGAAAVDERESVR
jgi:hypothetical protein